MTGFLNSVKADLLDRRLLPLVVVVVLALAGAVGYVVLGGGSSATSTSAGSPAGTPAGPPAGLSVSQTAPEKAVAETTAGVSVQRKGAARDPFTPLPQAAKEKSKATATGARASGSLGTPSSSAGSGSSSSSGSGESGSSTPKPSTPAKPKVVYHVAVLFGIAPPSGASASEQEQQLTPYENLKLLAPLPSAKQALIVFRGVTAGGKSATFTIVSEAILHGQARCLPSEAQCEAIELKPGQAESLEYISSSGQPLVYDLQLVNITSSVGSGANVESLLRSESKAGRELLKHEGLIQLPGLRYSSRAGVLVLAGHAAFTPAARQHHER